jgi:hypothetical protein
MEGEPMEGKKVDLDRIRVPTRVIVHRSELAAAALAELVQRGELASERGVTCELEAGGVVVARGRIVRRRGGYYFKVLETTEEAHP